MASLTLRITVPSDLPVLFEFQRDVQYNHMAAFTPANPGDRDAYLEKWNRLLQDSTVSSHTVVRREEIVGQVMTYPMEGEPQLSYGVGRPFWGQQIASEAVGEFLRNYCAVRPLFARVAFDNHGSIRVLEKNGFIQIGTDTFHANARGQEIEEIIFELKE